MIAEIVTAGAIFTCTPRAVYDGDGPLWCQEGPRIRLAGIAAREMDGTCNANQPCPEATAEQARDHLVSLVGRRVGVGPHGHILVRGTALRCVSVGATYGRTAAWCVTAQGVDLSCAMVASGFALRWARYWGEHRCGGR